MPWIMRRPLARLGSGAVLLLPLAALAQQPAPPPAGPAEVVDPVAGGGLTYALGLAVIDAPTYAGGAGRELKLRPLWSLRYGRFRLSGARSSGLLGAATAERGSGASADLVETDRWSLGLGLRFDNGRQPGDDPALAGLPEIRQTLRGRLSGGLNLGGGFPGWTEDDGGGLVNGLKALILPAIALALVQAAILARVTRSAVLEVMREDYVRTARAKGLSRRQTLWRHVLRNAMIPVLTIMGLQFANLITGTIVVENVFVLPGIGRLVFQAIANRDLVVVRDVVMGLVAVVVVVNFLVDVLYAVVDPRLKASDA